jgi:ATP adenylyltransferase
MLNLYPYNSGHLMVVPHQHTGSLPELDPDAGAAVFATSQLAVQALTDVMHPAGFNLGINQGKVAGAGIADHIHLHVVPRWDGDTNFMPVLADVKVMPELLAATAAKLRPVFAELSKRP